MSAALEVLDNVLEAARIDDLAPVEAMDQLLEVELKARHDRRIETNRVPGLRKLRKLRYIAIRAFSLSAQDGSRLPCTVVMRRSYRYLLGRIRMCFTPKRVVFNSPG
jgi:hypothetical protein